MDAIRQEVVNLAENTLQMMNLFTDEHRQMHEDWQEMSSAMTAGAAQKIKVEAKAEAEALRQENNRIQQEQVLEYIRTSGDAGVKAGDMQEPLGILRMRIGKITKELLELGKIRKAEDGKYYIV